MALRKGALAACLLLISAGIAADNRLPSMGDPANQVMTPSAEAEFGRQLMHRVRADLPMLDDPLTVGYINDLGHRLVSHAQTPEFNYQFFVVNRGDINAFAMPGGYIGVNAGLILAARTESELASVIAHEIAHVTQRHLARRMAASQRINLQTLALVLAGLVIGAQDPEAGSATAIGGLASSAERQLSYSRDHEREADRIGMQILHDAGFEPAGMSAFFERLAEASRYQDRPPSFLSTHPLTQQRLAEARARADQLSGGAAFSTESFPFVRARLRVLRAESPREAVELFRSRVADGGGQAGDRYGLALALSRAGSPDEAREIVDGLIESEGELTTLLLTRAEIERAAGRLEAAKEQLEEALSLYPGNLALQQTLAETALAAGDPQLALANLGDALQTHPEQPELYRLKARAADAAGQPAEARIAMAQFYHRVGDLSSALDQLKQVTAGRHSSDIQRARARALEEDWKAQARQSRGPS